jgi:outer membrane protein OmpA-like peptidoglycan-associated protein
LSQTTLWYNEEFNDNSRSWSTGEGENSSSSISGGQYILDLQAQDEGSWIWYGGTVFIDPNKDYIIETNMTQKSGVDNYAYCILWGVKDVNNHYGFGVTSNGYFIVFKRENGDYSKIKDWTENSVVKGMNNSNKLTIAKRQSRWRLSVNDQEVYSMNVAPFYGFALGFALDNQMKIAIENLIVKQDNVINLIPNLVTGYKKVSLGPNVNTKYSEKSPVISPDGKTLWYSIEGDPDNTGGEEDGDEIYYSTAVNDTDWSKNIHIEEPLNNSGPNSVISVTPDNNTMLINNTYNDDGSQKGAGFSLTYRTSDGWTLPQDVVVANYYNNAKYIESCMSSDRKSLIMAIERDDTYGDRDLYASFLKDDGTWTEPKNLGGDINTFGEEMSPFLAADGVTLYFASNGRPGYGSNDVFLTRRLDETWTSWSEPQNLGSDINSAKWDAYYRLDAAGKYAYLVSTDNAIGSGDIFRIKVAESAKPQPVVLIYGKVLNSKTNEPLAASITYRDLKSDMEIGIATSNPTDGSYKIVLPLGRVYSFLASKERFISVSENFDVEKLDAYKEIEKNLYLAPIEVGTKVRLNNIFFDFGKATLRDESFPELNRVVLLMNQNSGMVIEIGGHTDNVGSDAANLKLSQDRATSVREYVVSKGIAADRVTSRGYGETIPQTTNDTEEGRQLNRRVEFTILKQ